MATEQRARDDHAWAQIERDKQFDKRLRRICVIAWTITLVLTLMFAILTVLQVAQFLTPDLHLFGWGIIAGAMAPLVIVLGLLSTLIATLATVGVFLRLRTTSLHEIQLRLADLEQMLMRDDAPDDAKHR